MKLIQYLICAANESNVPIRPQKGGSANGCRREEGFPLPLFQIAAYKLPISDPLTSN